MQTSNLVLNLIVSSETNNIIGYENILEVNNYLKDLDNLKYRIFINDLIIDTVNYSSSLDDYLNINFINFIDKNFDYNTKIVENYNVRFFILSFFVCIFFSTFFLYAFIKIYFSITKLPATNISKPEE